MRTPHLIAAACLAGDREAGHRAAELAIWAVLQNSRGAYPRAWASPDEGAMVLADDLDVLWGEVRAHHAGRARAAAAQVGAMGLRFVSDLYGVGSSVRERDRWASAACWEARSAVGPARLVVSDYEAFGFLKREFDGLWSAIRFDDPPSPPAMRLTGMAVRLIAEIGSAPTVQAVGS